MTRTSTRHAASAAMLLSATVLAGCATTSAKTPAITYSDPPAEIAAMPAPEPLRPVEVVTIPEPLPLPGQLKPVAARARSSEAADPRQRVGAANAAARVQPTRDGYVNAIQQYPWTEGALYQVYTAPGQVTDIALQEGEQLVGAGPVAAGDTVRWIIGDTVSGSGSGIATTSTARGGSGAGVAAISACGALEGTCADVVAQPPSAAAESSIAALAA